MLCSEGACHSHRFIIGVYDTHGSVASQIRSAYGRKNVLIFEGHRAAPLAEGEAYAPIRVSAETWRILEDEAAKKEEFLRLADFYVLVVETLEGISLLIGVLRQLLANQVRGLLVIADMDLKPILAKGTETETRKLQTLSASQQFVVRGTFELQILQDMVASSKIV